MTKLNYKCTIELAGIPLLIELEYADAYRLYRHFQVEESAPVCSRIFVSDKEWAFFEEQNISRNAYNEANLITAYASDVLLDYRRCVFHSVALRHGDDGFIIAAASGVGKTTQAKTLFELYPGEFELICGDRPVLQLLDDGTVFVHPSPWNGKEGMEGGFGAKLSKIILLERGDENQLFQVSKRDAVLPVFSSIIFTGRTEELIRKASVFENDLLNRVECWRLINKGVPESTQLLYNVL